MQFEKGCGEIPYKMSLPASVFRDEVFGIVPLPFSIIGMGLSVRVHKIDTMFDGQMSITVRLQTLVGLPAIGDYSCSLPGLILLVITCRSVSVFLSSTGTINSSRVSLQIPPNTH